MGPIRSVWAFPGTVVGAVLGLASLGVPRADEGTIVFLGSRGYARLLGRLGVTAQTWGQVIVTNAPLTPELRAHEREHVRQWMALGPLFPVAYLLESLRAWAAGSEAYRGNRFELRAVAAAARSVG